MRGRTYEVKEHMLPARVAALGGAPATYRQSRFLDRWEMQYPAFALPPGAMASKILVIRMPSGLEQLEAVGRQKMTQWAAHGHGRGE